ncbi:hypothetical protein CcaCcLH18_03033 [Colletotrichum camelliae]|nr:hypothetical protein CcaCcLH18_03033 [Colletotrichum camelliae]
MVLFPNGSHHDEYPALLDCSVFRPQTVLVREEACILLRRLSGDQYARIPGSGNSGVQFFNDHEHLLEGKGKITTIYVKQEPSYILPEITIEAIFHGETQNEVSRSFSVIAAYPPEHFLTTQNIVRVDRPKPGQTVVALRFGCSFQQRLLPVADVLLGLQRNEYRWEICYDELPFQNTGLDEVYKNNPQVNKARLQGESNISSQMVIHEMKHERRGRLFLQLQVFGTFQISSILARGGLCFKLGWMKKLRYQTHSTWLLLRTSQIG